MLEPGQTFAELLARGAVFVSVTVVDSQGSTPGAVGSRLLIPEEGPLIGTVGGGRLEARALEEGRAMLAGEVEHRFVDWSLNKDIGMTCGGRVKLYFELFNRATWDIRVFGAGHVAQALVRLLGTMNCRVHCYDTRQEWLERLPSGARLIRRQLVDIPEQVAQIPASAFVLLMTMGHATDLPILKEFLSTRTQAYLGVIGSKSKRAVLSKELIAGGIPADLAEDFFCPIGLPVGSDDPAEIAVSVAAQLLAERDKERSVAERASSTARAEGVAAAPGGVHG